MTRCLVKMKAEKKRDCIHCRYFIKNYWESYPNDECKKNYKVHREGECPFKPKRFLSLRYKCQKFKKTLKIWKELREYHSRRKILGWILIHYSKITYWFILHLFYKIFKFEHEHKWNVSFFCYICRKAKRDIDLERLHDGKTA